MAARARESHCPSILVVEDDRDIREALRQALELEGYHVLTAENGQVGLALLATAPRPCLVLLDLMMPVMNGLELLGALRADEVLATIPVVMVSAYPEAKGVEGTVGFIKKPIDLDVLMAFVERHCT